MKKQLRNVLTAAILLLMPSLIIAQAPPLGAADNFVLYTSVGAMQNVGTYQYLTVITGDIGTNSGSNTNFGNVNGVMHEGDGVTAQCNADLINARDFLVAATHDSAIVNPVIGNDSIFKAGTYLLPGEPVSLTQTLTLDGEGNPDAVFIFKMPAVSPVYAFSTSTNAEVKLINGAQACNVFWYISGAVSIASGTSMKGTIIAGGAFSMASEVTLEGRALTINGSVTVDNGDLGLSAYLPVDISTPLPTGPAAPVFVESKDYAVFSSLGDVSDDGTSHVTGSVGSNSALPTGFNPLFVSGNIDGMNPATAGAKADLLLVYNSLNTLSADIELLAPEQFGHNLILTPNTYVMNTAVTFTDTLILDATGNEDAVFIIKTYGAFASAVHSKVLLENGTQAKNVFWMVNGAVSIGDSSSFKGTIVANNGAIDMLTGASLDGRALTTDGAISTTGMTTVLPIPFVSITPKMQYVCAGDSAGFVINPIGEGSYTYQWRKGSVNLTNGGSISGANNDTLIINPVSDSDTSSSYNVVVFDALEPSDTSVNVSLQYYPVPDITVEPANQVVCTVGNTASFSVTAMGIDLTYQWRKGSENYTNTTSISGATSETLTIDPVDNADIRSDYNVVISNTCGQEVTSSDASLSISTDLIITSEPTDQVVCEGSPASFSVAATADGITYQWRKGIVNLSNAGNISGATSATLTIDPVDIADVASDYNAIVSGSCAPNDTSVNASLSVNQLLPVSVTIEADANSVCAGTTVEYNATPVNGGTTPEYQWKVNGVNAGTDVDNYSYIPEDGDEVTVELTSNASCISGNPASSEAITMIVNPTLPVSVTIEADANSVCEGTTVEYNATPVNGGTTPEYQWKVNGVNAGTDADNYSYIPEDGDEVTVELTSNASCTSGNPASSEAITMIINTGPVITTQPENQTASVGSSVSFVVEATGVDVTRIYNTYRWRRGTTALINEGNISGALSATLTIDPVSADDAATDYNVIVFGTCLPYAISSDVSLEVTGVGIDPVNSSNDNVFTIYPNPFSNLLQISLNDKAKMSKYELRIYSVIGVEIINTLITNEVTNVETNKLPSGLYFYQVRENGKTIQSGKLISTQD
ncbi:MAG: ice-binding family protein [Salinivirgaceae bacterium]|nr:ice-binding family protein [Salinivirgaceae bacterium]